MPKARLLGTTLGFLVLTATLAAQPGKPTNSLKSSGSMLDSVETHNGKTLAQWKLQLRHDDPSRRTVAITEIVNFGDATSEVVPLLLERTRDRDVSPRLRALTALRIVAVSEKDVPAVVKELSRLLVPANEPQIAVRYEAVWTLQRFVEDAAPAIPALIIGSRDPGSWEVRHRCIQILWRVGATKNGPDERVVEALIRGLHDNAYLVKLESVIGLSSLGKPNNPTLQAKVISALEGGSVSNNKVFAIWSYAGLVAMNEKAAEPSLIAISKFLKGSDLEVKSQAAQALGALGARAKSRVPNLLPLLEDKEDLVVQGACAALAQIGEKDSKVMEGLLKLLEQKAPNKVAAACQALAQLGQGDSRVQEAIEKQLDRTEKEFDALRPLFRSLLEQLKKPKK